MKIKTQEVKKSILKSLKSIKKDKEEDENKFIIDDSGDDDEDDVSLDSDQEVKNLLFFSTKKLD